MVVTTHRRVPVLGHLRVRTHMRARISLQLKIVLTILTVLTQLTGADAGRIQQALSRHGTHWNDYNALFAAMAAADALPTSLNFNGSNAYLQVADAVSLNIPVNLTIEAWIKPNAVAGYQAVVSKQTYELGV